MLLPCLFPSPNSPRLVSIPLFQNRSSEAELNRSAPSSACYTHRGAFGREYSALVYQHCSPSCGVCCGLGLWELSSAGIDSSLSSSVWNAPVPKLSYPAEEGFAPSFQRTYGKWNQGPQQSRLWEPHCSILLLFWNSWMLKSFSSEDT